MLIYRLSDLSGSAVMVPENHCAVIHHHNQHTTVVEILLILPQREIGTASLTIEHALL
jgi:hypothetical protein